MKKKFNVILLGSDDNVYGFARSFYEEFDIVPYALTQYILNVTKCTKIINFIVNENVHDEDKFCNIVNDLVKRLKKDYEKIFLVPCSDYYMELCVKNIKKLNVENKFIDYKSFKEFNNKERFYKICDKYGILYPKSCILDRENYLPKINEINIDYPLILKPNNSNSEEYLNAKFDDKKKVYFINNKEELLNTVEKIYSSDYNDVMIIQQYIPGDDTNMRVLNVYCDKNAKVKMMSLGQPILEEYHPNTFGNYAAIVSLTNHIEIMDNIKKFLEDIKYYGTANFDIKYNPKDGKYYAFEINPRPGRSSFFTACAGKSLASCYVEDLVYNDIKEHMNNDKEILWLNVPMCLVRKYVKDEAIKQKIKKLPKYHTLFYKKDNSLKRKSAIYINYLRKIKYFPKYFIEKDMK